MSQAPAMPLFWGDYWSKTRRLSPTQHHAYLFLLGATWMNNCVPFADDDGVIAGEIGISVIAWRRVRPVLVRFFDLSGGTWRNHKLEEVWAEVMRRVISNRENGKRGGRPAKSCGAEKPQQNQYIEKPNGSVSPNPTDNPTEPIQNQNQRKISKEGSVGLRNPTGAPHVAPALVVVSTPALIPDPKRELYDLVKRVLGKNAGGLATKLVRHHDGDIDAALYTMSQVAEAAYPAEYLGRILSGSADTPEARDEAFYRRHGMRMDGTPFGADTWLSTTEKPVDPSDPWYDPNDPYNGHLGMKPR